MKGETVGFKLAMRLGMTALLILSFGVSGLTAEEGSGSQSEVEKKVITKYQRRSYFDFEDTLIRGKVLRPAGAYIYSRQHASFITKIKLKRSFMPELKSTGSGE